MCVCVYMLFLCFFVFVFCVCLWYAGPCSTPVLHRAPETQLVPAQLLPWRGDMGGACVGVLGSGRRVHQDPSPEERAQQAAASALQAPCHQVLYHAPPPGHHPQPRHVLLHARHLQAPGEGEDLVGRG